MKKEKNLSAPPRHHTTDHCPCHDEQSCHDNCSCHKQAPIVDERCAGDPSFKAQDPNKGVSLGPEVESEIAGVLLKRYARFLKKDEQFRVKTEVCHHFGLVSCFLSNPSNTTSVCLEVSVECEPNNIENPIDAYNRALDTLDTVWLEYFDSDRISHYLPIWQAYDHDGLHVNVRLEHSNPALDDEASAFLKAHGFTEGGLSPEDYDDE